MPYGFRESWGNSNWDERIKSPESPLDKPVEIVFKPVEIVFSANLLHPPSGANVTGIFIRHLRKDLKPWERRSLPLSLVLKIATADKISIFRFSLNEKYFQGYHEGDEKYIFHHGVPRPIEPAYLTQAAFETLLKKQAALKARAAFKAALRNGTECDLPFETEWRAHDIRETIYDQNAKKMGSHDDLVRAASEGFDIADPEGDINNGGRKFKIDYLRVFATLEMPAYKIDKSLLPFPVIEVAEPTRLAQFIKNADLEPSPLMEISLTGAQVFSRDLQPPAHGQMAEEPIRGLPSESVPASVPELALA